MGTKNSSEETRRRAKLLAEAIGRSGLTLCQRQASHLANFFFFFLLDSYHIDLNMESVVTAVRQLFGIVTGFKPNFRVNGGSNAENLALQNIQVSFHTPRRNNSYLIVWTGTVENGSCIHVRATFALGTWKAGGSARVGKRECR